MKIKRNCEICGKEFFTTENYIKYNKKRFGKKVARYCSKICFYKSPARKPNLGKFGKQSFGWKGGRIYERGYKLIIVPKNHPYGIMKAGGNKYIREHRLVMEKHLGRYLKPEEVVHHINGNLLDNRIENLMILSNSLHCRLHRKIQWENFYKLNPKIFYKCVDCGKIVSHKSLHCQSCAKKGILNPNSKNYIKRTLCKSIEKKEEK